MSTNSSKWWPDVSAGGKNQSAFTARGADDYDYNDDGQIDYGDEANSLENADGAGNNVEDYSAGRMDSDNDDVDDGEDDGEDMSEDGGSNRGAGDDEGGFEDDGPDTGAGPAFRAGRKIHNRGFFMLGSVDGLYANNSRVALPKLPNMQHYYTISTKYRGAASKIITSIGRDIFKINKGQSQSKNRTLRFENLKIYKLRKIDRAPLARLLGLEGQRLSRDLIIATLVKLNPAVHNELFMSLAYNGEVNFLSDTQAKQTAIRGKPTTIRVSVHITPVDKKYSRRIESIHKRASSSSRALVARGPRKTLCSLLHREKKWEKL